MVFLINFIFIIKLMFILFPHKLVSYIIIVITSTINHPKPLHGGSGRARIAGRYFWLLHAFALIPPGAGGGGGVDFRSEHLGLWWKAGYPNATQTHTRIQHPYEEDMHLGGNSVTLTADAGPREAGEPSLCKHAQSMTD